MQETTKRTVNSNQKQSDFPSGLLAKIVRAEGKISIDHISQDGDIKISIPLKDLGLPKTKMANTPFSRTNFFVDLLGEILVRKNIDEFAKILDELDPSTYERTVNRFKHRHFGIVTDEKDVVRMQFHVSLVQRILTEDMADIFGL